MSKNITKWIVEEVHNGVLSEREFDDYKDALEVFDNIKENRPDSNVSLHKSTKKLLTE